MRLQAGVTLVIIVIAAALGLITPNSAAASTTLERWRNCTLYKDIWPDAARWSNDAGDGGGESAGKIPLYIAGFLPFSATYYDKLVCTVLLAVEHVNAEPNLLEDYELRIIWNWTQARPGPALRYLYDVIYNSPQVVMAWGPTYSSVGEVINRVAAQYHLVQVGIAQFQADDRLLEYYPYTVQIYPANSVFNPARVALLKAMDWKRAAIVYQDVNLFRDEMIEFATMMKEEGMHTIAIETMNDDPRTNIESLKRHDARIIFLSVYTDTATRVFCEVYRQGLYGKKYVWVLMGWYHANWWVIETNKILARGEDFCLVEEVGEAIDGYLSMRGFEVQEDLSTINFNGIYPDEDRLEFFEFLQGQLVTTGACDSYGYDQIMTIALALNASSHVISSQYPGLSLADFTYDNKVLADIMVEETKKTRFVGLTGPGAFDEYGSRESDAVIQQIQDGVVRQIFVYDRKTDGIRWKQDFKWKGSFVPVDGPTEIKVDVAIGNTNKIIILTAASLGILLAIAFLAINVGHRNKKALKISSPKLNNVIAAGGVLLYSSIFLTIEALQVPNEGDPIVLALRCQSVLLVASVGLSLSFGALFMKTYRIHQIYTSAMKARKVLKGLTDSRLLMAIFCFVVIDLVFFALWLSYDPMTIRTVTFTPIFDETEPEKEIFKVPTLNTCTSDHMIPFLGALGVYKGGLLLFGVFLAWSVRNIRIMELNDSKFIALSVYTVCLTCVISAPFAYVYSSQGDINFVFTFVGGAISIATTVVLCLVFVPKIIALSNPDDVGTQRRVGMGTSTEDTFKDKDAVLEHLHSKLQQKLQERKELEEELARLDRLCLLGDY
ncbi:gamma-aminobutyric acid type B receptor subunit 1-like [Diadema antillarum]|uniref:gamma-aminobutyric acid type B receptor subunit 1-like n=1 Tax=Diadema antillarum TaxID=105358 RepID=UPI003A89D720